MSQPPGLANILNQLSTFRWGAHHPDCRFHDHHIIRILGHPFCLGCVSMWTGVFIGILLLWQLFLQGLRWELIMSIGFAMTPFPYLQMYYQKKWFKILARMGLGIGSVLFIGAPFFLSQINIQGIGIRIVVISVYLVLVRHALKRRQATMNRPCDDCKEGVFPLCSWNQKKIINASKSIDLDEDGREFLLMVAESVCAPPDEQKVVMLSASDFD